jgi:hypothetical protein
MIYLSPGRIKGTKDTVSCEKGKNPPKSAENRMSYLDVWFFKKSENHRFLNYYLFQISGKPILATAFLLCKIQKTICAKCPLPQDRTF